MFDCSFELAFLLAFFDYLSFVMLLFTTRHRYLEFDEVVFQVYGNRNHGGADLIELVADLGYLTMMKEEFSIPRGIVVARSISFVAWNVQVF